MTWLITGGAGYIGAHVARAMTEAGERVVVLDNVTSGVPSRLPEAITLVRGSTQDTELVARVCAEHEVTGVLHLAAHKQVGESVEKPELYYRDNVGGLAVLLETVAAAGVRRFVFSSSAAVYGNPDVGLITESTATAPVNPYGETKLAGEWLVRAAGHAHGMATACLRYFNVAGAAAPELADIGVYNVIPMVFDRLSRGEAPRIFGDDYPTPDGTCVRDYIHVADLAEAHLAAAHAAVRARRERRPDAQHRHRAGRLRARADRSDRGRVRERHPRDRRAAPSRRRPARGRLLGARRGGARLEGAARGARDGRVGLGRLVSAPPGGDREVITSAP